MRMYKIIKSGKDRLQEIHGVFDTYRFLTEQFKNKTVLIVSRHLHIYMIISSQIDDVILKKLDRPS